MPDNYVDRYFIVDINLVTLNIQDLEKYDTQGMFKIYDKWPEIAQESYNSNQKKINFTDINYIIFAGMGGSGAIGDVFASILSETNIHVDVVKGYHLPITANSNTLVIPISISGNTDETIKILEEAYQRNCKLIAFTSGGQIEKICLEKSIEFRKIKEFHSPRASFPSFLYSILDILSNILPIENEEVIESIRNLKQLKKIISSENISKSNQAISLAKWIKDVPLVYYPFGLQSSAIRFKNSLQENSKIHVIIEDIVESCHNGIVAWERKSNIQPIFIRGTNDHDKTKERFKILTEYFEENKIESKEIISNSGNILSKIINLIYLLDYVSIYKAVLNKIDPSPVKSIDFVKNRLK